MGPHVWVPGTWILEWAASSLSSPSLKETPLLLTVTIAMLTWCTRLGFFEHRFNHFLRITSHLKIPGVSFVFLTGLPLIEPGMVATGLTHSRYSVNISSLSGGGG